MARSRNVQIKDEMVKIKYVNRINTQDVFSFSDGYEDTKGRVHSPTRWVAIENSSANIGDIAKGVEPIACITECSAHTWDWVDEDYPDCFQLIEKKEGTPVDKPEKVSYVENDDSDDKVEKPFVPISQRGKSKK